jgi:phosphoserine aminotransferase
LFDIRITIYHNGESVVYHSDNKEVAGMNLLKIEDNYHILVTDGTSEQQNKIKIKALLQELEECEDQEYVVSGVREYLLGNVAKADISWITAEQITTKLESVLVKIENISVI